MASLLDVDVSFETVPVSTPPIAFDTADVNLPTIGPFSFPAIRTPGLNVTFPTITIPTVDLPIPALRISTTSVDLGSVGPIRIPTGVSAWLTLQRTTFTIPVVDFTFTVPTWVSLHGPFLSYSDIGPIALPSVSIPDVTTWITTFVVGGQSFDLPDVSLPAVDVSLPTIGPIALPDISVPVAARLTGVVRLMDPTTLSVTPIVHTDALTAFVTQFMPDGFIADPVAWTFDAVFSEAERRVKTGLLGRLARLAEVVLDHALESETKQALAQYKEKQ